MSEGKQVVAPISQNEENDVLKTLTIPVQRFAEHYAVTANALKSSRLAGLHEDYGSHLLGRDDVQRAVTHFRAILADNSSYNPAKLVRQWAQQASFEPAALLNDDWSVKNINELDDDTRAHLSAALVGIEVIEKTGSRTIKPKFAKVESLEHLGKLMKLYDQEKQSGTNFSLNISLSAQANTSEDAQTTEDLGHIRIVSEEQ